jgi:hypothetical protein
LRHFSQADKKNIRVSGVEVEQVKHLRGGEDGEKFNFLPSEERSSSLHNDLRHASTVDSRKVYVQAAEVTVRFRVRMGVPLFRGQQEAVQYLLARSGRGTREGEKQSRPETVGGGTGWTAKKGSGDGHDDETGFQLAFPPAHGESHIKIPILSN